MLEVHSKMPGRRQCQEKQGMPKRIAVARQSVEDQRAIDIWRGRWLRASRFLSRYFIDFGEDQGNEPMDFH